jgi:hypothetical protein
LSGEGLAPNLILSSESSRLQLMCDMLLVSGVVSKGHSVIPSLPHTLTASLRHSIPASH